MSGKLIAHILRCTVSLLLLGALLLLLVFGCISFIAFDIVTPVTHWTGRAFSSVIFLAAVILGIIAGVDEYKTEMKGKK